MSSKEPSTKNKNNDQDDDSTEAYIDQCIELTRANLR